MTESDRLVNKLYEVMLHYNYIIPLGVHDGYDFIPPICSFSVHRIQSSIICKYSQDIGTCSYEAYSHCNYVLLRLPVVVSSRNAKTKYICYQIITIVIMPSCCISSKRIKYNYYAAIWSALVLSLRGDIISLTLSASFSFSCCPVLLNIFGLIVTLFVQLFVL